MVCRRGIAKAGESASRSVIVDDFVSLEYAHISKANCTRTMVSNGLSLCKSKGLRYCAYVVQYVDNHIAEIKPHMDECLGGLVEIIYEYSFPYS